MSYKETDAYQAHQQLGFPKIDDLIQLEMITTDNYKPIMDLCPQLNNFPLGLLNDYITVTKQQLKAYLIKTNFVENQLNSYSSTYDGYWLNKSGEKYVFFERERGNEFNHKYLSSEDEVLNQYVNQFGKWCK